MSEVKFTAIISNNTGLELWVDENTSATFVEPKGVAAWITPPDYGQPVQTQYEAHSEVNSKNLFFMGQIRLRNISSVAFTITFKSTFSEGLGGTIEPQKAEMHLHVDGNLSPSERAAWLMATSTDIIVNNLQEVVTQYTINNPS